MQKTFIIEKSELLTTERSSPNWWCRLKPVLQNDKSITIDVWGHGLTQIETEDIAEIIRQRLNQ